MSSTEILIPDLHAQDTSIRKRLILAVDALDKHGKTNFALTAPKPLVYLDFDIGKEGVLEKAPNRAGIITSEPFLFLPSEITFDIDNEEERTKKVMAAADPQLTRFRAVYRSLLKDPVLKKNGKLYHARTIVIDTGSEAWELLRLCYLGKVAKVLPHHYTEVNGLMRDLVRLAFESNVNVIWLHKLKAEWKDNAEGKGRKTGVLERSGFEQMAYLAQANLLLYRVNSGLTVPTTIKWKPGEDTFELPIEPRGDHDLGFRLLVGNSRHNPELEGLQLQNDMINFKTIASIMLPDSTDADWADSI